MPPKPALLTPTSIEPGNFNLGVPAPSPHDFRRAFAIERWRAGVDILTISRLMGHTSLQVMNRYLKQMGADLEGVAQRTSPGDLNF